MCVKSFIFVTFSISFIVLSNSCTKVFYNQIARATNAQKYEVIGESILNYNDLEITIDKAESGSGSTHYFFFVKVKNNSDKIKIFDSAELELVDDSNGLTWYSISKDKSSVSVPIGMTSLIMSSTLKPGRMISGTLFFTTQVKEARSQKLQLIYGTESLLLQNKGIKTGEDLRNERPTS